MLGISMWLCLFAAPQQQSQQQPCCFAPGDDACIGEWEGPYELQISCLPGSLPDSDCAVSLCGNLGYEFDEIGHAALIPAGPNAGHILLWTGCDYPASHSPTREYKTHVWNPATPAVPPTFHPPIAGIISNSTVGPDDDGPFCSGHVWILDENKKPKLLAVGGNDRRRMLEVPCLDYMGGHANIESGAWPTSCGVKKVYWFDPDPDTGPPAWSGAPVPDLPYGLWYPTVITYQDTVGRRFHPIVLGGSEVWFEGCNNGPVNPIYYPQGLYHQFPTWWRWPTFGQGWVTETSTYRWHQYPRALLLSDNTILVAGSTVICESPRGTTGLDPHELDAFGAAQPYGNSIADGGQNPVRLLSNAGTTLAEGPDPNVGGQAVGGWHYNNAVILHTLKNKYDDPAYPSAFQSNYNLDRVIALNGVTDWRFPADQEYRPALRAVREYRHSTLSWTTKDLAPTGREYGAAVVLPDGTILSVGGRNQIAVNDTVEYLPNAERFDPQLPLSLGTWKAMASRPNAPGAIVATPRAYHSVAMLLKSGNVVLMGGRKDTNVEDEQGVDVNTLDTAEVYRPPYTHCTKRPQITSFPGEMHYETPYQIVVNQESRVDYACLIGVSSVTHHFDYGQRYVELMVRNPESSSLSDGILEILPPTESLASMAPEGYYMLFVVDIRDYPQSPQERIPSVQGEFVKVTFNP